MKTRIISGVVAIPILLFFIIYGGLPLKLAVAVLSLIGMYELYKAVSGKIKAVHIAGFILEILYSVLLIFCLNGEPANYSLDNIAIFMILLFNIIIAMFLVILAILVFNHKNSNIHDGAITIFGFVYVGILLSLITFIRDISIFYAWLPFIFAFVSDTGAYFTGSFIGKHKLTPELSPKKTIEGSIGGVIITAIFTGVYVYICKGIFTDININVPFFIIVGAAGAILSQIGDLAASSIKRFTGIKDYGNLMPGHGGVLDRFDSVLFTLPVVFFVAFEMINKLMNL